MIANYTRPQLLIRQLLAATPAALLDRMNPLVIGPNYHVVPYSEAPTGDGTAYLTAGLTLALPEVDSDEILDAESVRLFAKDLELALGSGTGTIPSLAEAHVVKLAGTTVAAQALEIGDIFISGHATNAGFKRRITGFRGQAVAAAYAQDAENSSNPSAQGALSVTEVAPLSADFQVGVSGSFAGLVKGASYGGKYGDLFTVTCTTAGAPGTAVVSIRSASGLYDADGVATTNSAGSYNLPTANFEGAQITLSKAGAVRDLAVGDKIYFTLKAAYTTLAAANLAITGAAYTGTQDTTYLIRVITGGASGAAVVQISDTAGIDIVETHVVTSGAAFTLGTKGLSATFTSLAGTLQAGLKKGDIYTVSATAATESTTTFDKVVLDGPAIDLTTPAVAVTDEAVTWTSRISFTGELIPTETDAASRTWTNNGTVAGGVVLAANAKAKTTRAGVAAYKAMVNSTGELFASYRAIVPAASGEGLLTFTSTDEVDAALGSTHGIQNTLAYGVKRALAGADGRSVYALRTNDVDVDAFSAAFAKVQNTDVVYALAVLSNDLEVKQAVATHVSAMSAESRKNFRRAYVGTDIEGEYAILQTKANNTNVTATITALDGGFLKVTQTAGGVGFNSLGIVSGDKFRTNYAVDGFGVATYTEYPIDEVLSDTELSLQSGPGAAVIPAVKFEIWKADTAEAQIAKVKTVAAAISNRRVANIWSDRATALVDGVTTIIPNMFAAAEIAGKRCALYPQQGLTNATIATFTNAANMFLRYSQEQLDDAAAAGNFLIVQDVEGGDVYIRHQLTTSTALGSLYYEDSIGVIVDRLSFDIKDILSQYIGRRNTNAETLAEIERRLRLLLDKAALTSPANDIGPMIISYNDLSVEIDAVLKDKIVVDAEAVIPLPINNITVTLRGTTAA